MKRLLLLSAVFVHLFSALSFTVYSQPPGSVTYNFEGLGNGGTSFSSSSISFTLTGHLAGVTINNLGSDSPPSAGYADTEFQVARSGNIGGIQGPSGSPFHLYSLDVWPSVDRGANVQAYGVAIKIIGKRNGSEVATGIYNTVTFNQNPVASGGPWHRVFVTDALATTAIDEFTIELQGTQNYMAIDQFTFTPVTGPLPLNLLSFSANRQAGKVLLKWSTSNETAFSHFELERGIDATSFTKISTLNAGGAGLTNYQFIDPSSTGKVLYYRLKMVDTDGSYQYSPIVTIRTDVTATQLELYPNPVLNLLQVSLPQLAKGSTILSVLNSQGQVLRTKTYNNDGGVMTVPVSVADLTPGQYILQVIQGGFMESSSFIKR